MALTICVRSYVSFDVDPAALELLTRIASETSLRYAIHLITIAQLNAKRRKQKVVQIEDVERCYKLFVDVKRSTKLLIDHQKDFMFNDLVANTEESGTTG
jgi:RuvB-like protein 2